MDLKSILSPSEEKPANQPSPSTAQAHTSSPRSVTSSVSQPQAQPPTSNPQKFLERAHSGPVAAASRNSKHVAVGSPLAQTPLSSLPSHVISPLHAPSSSPLISPVPGTPGSPHAMRTLSAQSIDTLADLSHQSHQSHQGRPLPKQNPSMESVKTDSSARMALAQPSLTSNHRASIDINMLETSQEKRRTDFSTTSLKEEDKDRLAQLSSYLAEHPSAYESHVAYIALLHQAFINHVYPASQSETLPPKRDPATFELLRELKYARTTMEKLFAVGELTWLEWLQDDSMLAQSTEERIVVIEKFRQAVSEEVGSCRLWTAYGDWIYECYKWANQIGDTATDEDSLLAKEFFNSELVMTTWQEAVESTKHDLAQSHLVWNKYMTTRIAEFAISPNKELATTLLGLFEKRLRTPHMAHESTKQLLSSFMDAHFSQEQYFEIMEDTPRIMKDALRLLEDRSPFEESIEQAQSSSDRDAEYNAFAAYIQWEKTPAKRKRLDFESCNSLYQRAELRFPSDHNLWEDHVAFMLENGRNALQLLSRATQHCPWSGALWSQYLLASDRQGLSYEDTEAIKHKATSTGVLEAAGMSEVLKVYAAWCSYLRRRAFRPDHDEDDADIAEMGFRTSMENLKDLGVKLGLGDVPDPTFRLQRIYINFLSESGRWDNARREFDDAVAEYGKSWQFWLTFYHWEMRRWRMFASKSRGDESLGAGSVPHLATAVLKSALDREHLDYPEPVIEMLLSHCEDYEDADEFQACLLKARKVEQTLSNRRQAEALQQAQFVAASDPSDAIEDTPSLSRPPLAKRKREFNDSDETLLEVSKKSKTEEDPVHSVEESKADDLKRDREHATILVENLPDHSEQSKVRQYFSNCGNIKSMKVLENKTSAIIEFEDAEAAQYALSRDGQQFDDAILSVVLDTGSTVFLTNYTPETSESDVRSLLEPFGEIVNVRFPSLQANKRRRFCYVQFKLPFEAQAAVENLDAKDINGLELICKISNPAVKRTRQETSVNDGSTIFIGSLNFKMTEEELKKEFEQYGEIQLTRMPLHETMKNRNKGIAFITFSTTQQAQAALAMNGQPVKGRNIKVEIAQDTQGRSTKRGSSVAKNTNEPELGRSSSPTVVATEPRAERTVFLGSIPDTLNEARLMQAASKFGEVVKVILKTNHQGALIEYGSVASAGKATLALDGYEIDPGRNIRVVSEKEMLAQKPAQKQEDFAARPKVKTGALPAGTVVKRPTQPGNRGRKGGNIGQRSAMLHTANISHQPSKDLAMENNGVADDEQASNPKSNADFRALMRGNDQSEGR